MGLRCSKPPFDKLPAYTPLDRYDEELLRRLAKMVKKYDKTLDAYGAADLQQRATYGSEMYAIVKEFGYTGPLVYPSVRIYAGKLLAPVASALK